MGNGNTDLDGRLAVGDPATDGGSPRFGIDLYHAERIEDGLGDGFRLYTLDDEVYEARTGTLPASLDNGEEVSRLDSRIYHDDTYWVMKVNTPVTEKKPAYNTLRAFADTVEEATGEELETTWLDYQTTYEDGEQFEVGTRGVGTDTVTVSFQASGSIDIPEASYEMQLGLGHGMGAALGGGAAAAAGMLLGAPVGVIDGLLVGQVAGAGLGGVIPKARQYRENRKRRKRFCEAEGIEDLDLFDRVNEKHRLEQILDRDTPAPDRFTDRYNALRDEDLDELLDVITTAHFDGFDDQAGVTVTGTFDTYGGAHAMAAALSGVEALTDRPSIYADRDVFERFFDALTYEEGGDEQLLEDGERLVCDVMQRDDVAPSIIAWLDAEHADTVQDVGRAHSLAGDIDG